MVAKCAAGSRSPIRRPAAISATRTGPPSGLSANTRARTTYSPAASVAAGVVSGPESAGSAAPARSARNGSRGRPEAFGSHSMPGIRRATGLGAATGSTLAATSAAASR
jgi:hypothetical protein